MGSQDQPQFAPAPGIPVCAQDFYGAEALHDPVPCYHAMLAAGPLVWLEQNRILAIPRHDALTAALRNPAVFRSGRGVSINEDINALLVGSTLNSDPSAHDATRAITASAMTPKALRDVTGRIGQAAEALAERVVAKGRFDAAAELAPHLPLTIVRDLVGLSDFGRDRMLDWAAATFELMGDPKDRAPQARADMADLRRFLELHATEDQLAPTGWARRAWALGRERGISEAKCPELMRDYIAPSLDTTIAAIGYAIWLFAGNPGEWDKLRADPALIPGAIEEVVRLNTPIRAFTRHVAEDTVVGGQAIPPGTRVLMVFGAANRDPRRFDDPDRFDITRKTRGHVGFGHGIHACMGMHLARLEMSCLLAALAARVARFELTGPPRTVINSSIHAFASVPVRVEAAG